MSFPAYPKYKDSGVAWLGRIPSDWSVKRFKQVLTERNERSEFGDELLLSVSAYTGVSPRADLLNEGEHLSRAESLEGYKLCYQNDLVVNIMLAWNRGLGVTAYDGIVSPSYCVFALIDETEPRFLDYLVRSDQYLVYFKAFSAGVIESRLRLYTDTLRQLYCVLPSKSEQRCIVAFLDRETAKIDALVAEQQRLIELLKEKRQAVISHAVTKGLNPHAAMKPSGIEWLGDVPKHWETRTVSKVSTKITNGYVGPTRDILVEEGTPYIQATHIKHGRVNFDGGYFVTAEWSKSHAKSILAEGDVLIVQTGAGTGDVGLVTKQENGFNCHALIIVTCCDELLSGAFLAAVLQSTYGQQKLESIQTGGMHPHLNCGNVKYVDIPLPPKEEQADVLAYISKATQAFDALIAESHHATGLLQERRTALISAAVTGKFDVRGLAATEAA